MYCDANCLMLEAECVGRVRTGMADNGYISPPLASHGPGDTMEMSDSSVQYISVKIMAMLRQ